MSDDNKPKLGMRAPLGLKRTVETGKVKQSFSHGRSNTVVVEVKKRRILGRPGEEAAPETQTAPAPEPVAAPAPAPAPAPVEAAPRPMTALERREQQERLLREAEEARMNSLEENRRREDRVKVEQTEDEKRRVEENRKAGEARVAEPQPEPEVVAQPEADPAAARPAPIDAERPRQFGANATPARRPEPARRPSAGGRAGGDDRRQSGKLTVTRALDSDEGARARSLAALKRAREKERRAHVGQSGPREKQVRDVVVPDTITVSELANRMAERGADLVKALFKMGMPVTINASIDQDTAELLVTEFGHNITRVSESDVDIDVEQDVDADDTLQSRAPVVTIMGHVDHGKTSLLDALRGTDVVRGEAGGITQHIGAYQVQVKSGDKVTFLDTPGHEAFGEMRARGANITDIVVLVVAADDAIKPQTVEAINHTKAANVPMIVAINKIDKPEANAQKVREQLLQYEVIVEEMSGDVQDVEVSAMKKTGLDDLIEKILLQAELMELKANPDRAAEGTVIEAQLDKGRGAVATVLVRRGTLKVGDVIVVGEQSGKVRALLDDHGKQVKTAGPSMPVEILGLSGVPQAGDPLSVVENEARAREVAAYRAGVATDKRTGVGPVDMENLFSNLAAAKVEQVPLVVKADTQGSVGAIVGALNRLSTDEIKVRILSSGVGGITESDVLLAAASNAPVIGFNVRPNAKAQALAKRDRVEFLYYDVIYHLTDAIRERMAGQLGPEFIETVVGRAEIKQVFPAGKTGKAAGLLVTEGIIRKNLRARITRDDVIIYNGSVNSLRRFKDDVPEVRAGLECGVTFDATNDIKAGDYLETYEVEERARTL